MIDRPQAAPDAASEGRDRLEMDIDRMINEGLAGGQVTEDAGLIGETATDERETDLTEGV